MLLFIPRSLCALKRVAAKAEHARYGRCVQTPLQPVHEQRWPSTQTRDWLKRWFVWDIDV